MIGEPGRNIHNNTFYVEGNIPRADFADTETKDLMDMALVPLEATEGGINSPDKGNGPSTSKPRRKSMTSLYLKYFETAPDGKSRRCKFCKQSYSIVTATGNLGRHLNHRHPDYAKLGDPDQQVRQAQQTPVTALMRQQPASCSKKVHAQAKPVVDLDHLNWLLLKWFIRASIPPSAFEDEVLLNSFKFLNPAVKIWPKEKNQAVILEIFQSMREDIRASFENVNSKVSITLDFWTSYEQVFYMSVKCHWIDDDWSMHKVLLDVCHIPFPCTGSEILHALMKVLVTFNVDKKILCCTNDNSQQAIHACRTLKEEMDARNVPFCYMPCAARTLNLIIEDGLRTPKSILSKAREFVRQLNSHPEVAEDFKQFCAFYQEGSWKFPLDTSKSWNGDYAMLDIVRKAPNAIDNSIRKYEAVFESRKLLLSPAEKSIVCILHSYLEPFYKITTNLSTCRITTVGLVLFFMDHVFELISSCRETCRHEWLKIVAEEMSKRARNFNTQVFNFFTFMAAVLDPRIKKELIPESLSSDKNLEEARSYFKGHYANIQFQMLTNGFGTQDSNEDASVVSFAEEIARKRRRTSAVASTDELTQYLAEPPVPIATNVLDWWKANNTRYPRLSVMARDFLAVQGTSVDPDELFTSKGADIHKQQFCLSFGSMQAVMCINSWIQSGYKFKFGSTEIDFEKLVELAATAADSVNS